MSTNYIYDYAEGGFRVFPLWTINSDGTCGCDKEECVAPGKHPYVSAWQSVPYWDDEQLEMMVEHTVSTGFGVCLDQHLVIDIDRRNGGFESYAQLVSDLGVDFEKASGFVVDTGGGGKHIYFSVPKDVKLMPHHRDYPGIDFKNGTTGGSFVVGCGSLHASGATYEKHSGNPADLTECPAPLLQLLRREERKNTSYEGIEVTDNEIDDLLKYIPNADLHYDEFIKVGMAIHDATHGEGFTIWNGWAMESSKYDPEVMGYKWHSFGKSENPVRVGSLFKMAQDNGYIRPVTFETQEAPASAEDKERPPEPKPKHVRMLEALLAKDEDEMARVANMAWVIDGLIPAESFGVVFGEPGCGKSFSMVDMACSVSSGTPWQGQDTGEEGVVVYISAEGGNGMRFRKRAWEQVNGVSAPLMRVLPIATIIDNPKDSGELVQVMREYKKRIGQPIKMVVVDTLNRSMEGNENDNSDMAGFVRGCERIQHEHDCSVVVVHHSGKDLERGARGASALKAATDFEISVQKTDMMVCVTHTRSKDSEPIPPIQCKLEQVTVRGYTDYKGRPITSLVPVGASFGDEMAAKLAPLKEHEQALLDIIIQMDRDEGADDNSIGRKPLREAYRGHPAVAGAKHFDQLFKRTLDALRERGSIRADRQYVYNLTF